MRYKKSSFKLLAKGVQEITQAIEAIAVVFGCLPELECQLLWKTSRIVDTRPLECQLNVS